MNEITKHLNKIIDEVSCLYQLHHDLATRSCVDRIIDYARMAKADIATDGCGEADTAALPTPGGIALHRFAAVGGTVKLLGKRDRGTAPHQIYEIVVDRADGIFPNRAKVLCDDKEIFTIESEVNFNRTEKMAVAALHRYLKELAKNCGGAGPSRLPTRECGGAGLSRQPEKGGAA